ncbi:MAG TPA: SIS domain-containing protein [Herpetosiphonaceae bacterium]|nr:SIS domain-containing protein [Herpetosiphonaceae bacterium]
MTFLQAEIESQPEVVARLLEREAPRVATIVSQLPAFQYVLMAARGTSDHAATYAKYSWAALAGYPVALATPSLHTLYGAPPRMDGALVVGVSQSGQSPDIVSVLEEGRRQGRPTLAITNDGSSPLAAAADHVIELHAGLERSVAATKTYTAQLTVMALLAAYLRGSGQDELGRLPAALAAALEAARPVVERRAERYRYMEQCVIVGRGYNYATAFETALKLKELTYIMATAYSSADFRHGPIATVTEGLPVILIMPSGAALDDMLELSRELKERGAELVSISDADSAHTLATTAVPLGAAVPEWLSPITAIVPGQLLSLYLALAKGYDPDAPRGLQKVTRTF